MHLPSAARLLLQQKLLFIVPFVGRLTFSFSLNGLHLIPFGVLALPFARPLAHMGRAAHWVLYPPRKAKVLLTDSLPWRDDVLETDSPQFEPICMSLPG